MESELAKNIIQEQKRGRDTEMVQDPENLRPLKGNWNLRSLR